MVKGSEINDDPFAPVSKYAVDLVHEQGDETPIEWLHRTRRYGEKLATPDVTIADLIGDIDPIKAASQRLHYAHEGAIHFGIIPRTNRGIFAINELPDLQPRIQVGLFNILEEKDIQIRGFNIRIPLDVMLVFTANPEDYTNRGNIITPLKDRIDSQILTHYPRSMEDAIRITEQEAHIDARRTRGAHPAVLQGDRRAGRLRGTQERVRRSEVRGERPPDHRGDGESCQQRRAACHRHRRYGRDAADLRSARTSFPGLTGKVELVFEGEQEGSVKVSRALVGKAVREIFSRYFPDPLRKRQRKGREAGMAHAKGRGRRLCNGRPLVRSRQPARAER